MASKRALDAFRTDHRAFIDGALRHLLRSLELDGPQGGSDRPYG
jgi:hypothetical protein